MKKILPIFMAVMLIILSVIPVCAYSAGDIIDCSLITDITARINGYDIASCNYGGNTYIVAEDLLNYGFTVSYDNDTRTLSIARDYNIAEISSEYKKPAVSPEDVGKKESDILYTDIKTTLDGKEITGYNINGQTIISFDDLACYGELIWDNDTRTISLTLSKPEETSVSLDALEHLDRPITKHFAAMDLFGNVYPVGVSSLSRYTLGGKYNRFTATAFIRADYAYAGNIWIRGYDADGNETILYKTGMSLKTKPVFIDIDVSGYDIIEIDGYSGVAFYDPLFR